MLATEQEVLAYDIRRDAEYTRRRIEEYLRHSPDSPNSPAILGAAQRFVAWCDAADAYLTESPGAGVDQVREAWRREAVLSDVRFIPHGDFAALACVAFGMMAAILAAYGYASATVSTCIYAAVCGAIALGAFSYRRWTPSRLAVGPDARHSTLAAASAKELLNRSSSAPPRRYQPRSTRRRVR
ncbi:Uncharacterised protein [Mycobacteroides abscessus subsp. abscessus]|nr:Uncharacterised protein [Mycobacteroides abscessus subsp. abscessus]SKL78626.1 Uncharacterised protein [Mycobacteroides abscessus subsp. massiliense]SID71327.1 Uncharacterised protein [Mycobacteroides abscessus subsp. abscessus]SIK22943.1 Uncharacterised protein [Mycobacteroides abscessus subsp. abscessus]SKM15078.1 Uncharacterised protein [Mycobacteroides abscessus subsp. massiliense]